jgi:uncharacterized membrane protein
MKIVDALRSAIPDLSDDDDTAAARILLIITGALIIQMAFRVWAGLIPGSILGVGAVLILMVTGVQLWVFASSGIDMDRWGRAVGYGALLAVGAAAAMALFWSGDAWLPPLTTDESAFLHYSAQLMLDGVNPYTQSMLPALDLPGSVDWATPRVDGKLSDRLIYPAGSVIPFVPAVALGIEIRAVAWAAAVLIGAMAIAAVPPRWAIAPVAAMLAGRNIVFLGAAGDFDALWVLPMAAAVIYRADRRWLAAGVAFGIACSVKQIPWLAAPFLLLQHWKVGGADRRGFLKAMLAGGAVFTAVNLPWFLTAPGYWLRGVVTPLGKVLPKVSQGVGPTLLSYADLYPVSTTWHTVAIVTVAVVMATTVWLYPRRTGWAVWLTPLPLLFVRSRAFNSYFGAMTIVALLAMMASHGLVSARLPDLRDLWTPSTTASRQEVVADD